MDDGSLETGMVIGDRYAVEELVGLGGLAEVYKVRHLELGSVHALKLLTWNRKSLTERLLLEGRIQAQLTHPHIVRVTDVVRVDRRVGLLLEYIEGPSLEELLEHHGGLTVTDALGLFAPVLAAVAHAHDAGVLHRDIKPANVLLMRAPGGWVPKVADFGLAKVVEEGLGPNTRTGISMGTPGYMPPEQVRNSASVDSRTDIFALGVVLYEMIAGHRAFAPIEGNEIELTATIERTPPPLRALPPALWDAITRAIERDRDLRYADARSFAAGLGIADHPSLAASPDLVRVPLALDPSTYPSKPSTDGEVPVPSPAALADDSSPRSGRLVVAALFGSVLLAVLTVALMVQPVIRSRRAFEAQQSDEVASGLEPSTSSDGGLVAVPRVAGPASAPVPDPDPEVPRPVAPTVIEVLAPEPTAGEPAQAGPMESETTEPIEVEIAEADLRDSEVAETEPMESESAEPTEIEAVETEPIELAIDEEAPPAPTPTASPLCRSRPCRAKPAVGRSNSASRVPRVTG